MLKDEMEKAGNIRYWLQRSVAVKVVTAQVTGKAKASQEIRAVPLLYTLDDLSSLTVEFIGIPCMGFFLAILETGTGMSFEHSMFRAEVAVAKAAVTNDALGGFLAFLEVATGLAWSHVGRWWREKGKEWSG